MSLQGGLSRKPRSQGQSRTPYRDEKQKHLKCPSSSSSSSSSSSRVSGAVDIRASGTLRIQQPRPAPQQQDIMTASIAPVPVPSSPPTCLHFLTLRQPEGQSPAAVRPPCRQHSPQQHPAAPEPTMTHHTHQQTSATGQPDSSAGPLPQGVGQAGWRDSSHSNSNVYGQSPKARSNVAGQQSPHPPLAQQSGEADSNVNARCQCSQCQALQEGGSFATFGFSMDKPGYSQSQGQQGGSPGPLSGFPIDGYLLQYLHTLLNALRYSPPLPPPFFTTGAFFHPRQLPMPHYPSDPPYPFPAPSPPPPPPTDGPVEFAPVGQFLYNLLNDASRGQNSQQHQTPQQLRDTYRSLMNRLATARSGEESWEAMTQMTVFQARCMSAGAHSCGSGPSADGASPSQRDHSNESQDGTSCPFVPIRTGLSADMHMDFLLFCMVFLAATAPPYS